MHLRADRFDEGHLAGVLRAGHLSAILRRLAAIAAELRAGAGRTRLRVEEGDLTRVAADAIVNAASSALSGGGGVDGAIHRAAGPELLAACRRLGRCPVGEARLTPAFRLPARWVIHAVGPVWQGGDAGEAALLAAAYRASLELALGNGCRTVAFPAISCGAHGYPVAAAAAVAVSTIRAWADLHPGLDEVILVAFEPPVARALARAVGPVGAAR
ncbi:MAG: O-acetyl-ADP-ribose deacetylase [Kofleriaceae bacterium]|nr:O-acetyl-ADP-ribose deacetylase [Kofleriaceae bacterium]MCL4223183.1 O-acetyl-ADP-ribose deacetylase [Myxococcales bacterium]